MNTKSYKLIGLGSLFSLLIILHFSGDRTRQVEEQMDFASQGVIRNTELGKALPVIQKPLQEAPSHEVKLIKPSTSQKCGLKKTNSYNAWKSLKATGSKDIVVAVIDSGIDVHHPNLKQNLWVNTLEIPGNHIDDDRNGFVDDVNGWNFVSNNNDLTDNHGHGTHISAIIGAVPTKDSNISGVAPNVSLMTLKYFDPKVPGTNNLKNTIRAIDYAVAVHKQRQKLYKQKKLKKEPKMIINYSGGGLSVSQHEKAAIDRARQAGILFVAAAGNERTNTDEKGKGYYPADYKLDNIISVTAINCDNKVLPTSNYGSTTVDIAAPGNDILSTIPLSHGSKTRMTGTSQATAFATGVAVLLMAKFSDFEPHRIIKHITETGDLDKNLIGKTRHRKRLNTYRALAILDHGVGVTGVIAKNTVNMDPSQFSSETIDSSSANGSSSGNLALFSKDLTQLMGAQKSKRRTRRARSVKRQIRNGETQI